MKNCHYLPRIRPTFGRLALPALAALALVIGMTGGCSKKTNPLETKAPPPSADAHPEMSVMKGMPPKPPAMGGGPVHTK